jgi:hypothetical protein
LRPKYQADLPYTTSIAPVDEPNDLFEDVSRWFNFKHMENDFNDFEEFPLNPWKHSELGPLLAVADVNGDGLDDVFVGNSLDQDAAIFIQRGDGSFIRSNKDILKSSSMFEDHGALFFDADGDGDLDLLVLSGAIEATHPMAWANRLYINVDGKGNFMPAQGALPALQDVYLRAIAYDIDGDGDLDLILGGRVKPKLWPLLPRSVVLRNDGNRFTDVTREVAPEFEYCGMITDLAILPAGLNKAPVLVAAGEWMPISIFEIQNGKLTNKTKEYGLENSNGFWFRLAFADLDGDGDLDIVSGNLGLNTRLTASVDGPFTVYAKDFDNNGTLDPMIGMFENKKLYPLYQKEVLFKHMPILKKKFLYAKDYSVATMDQLWPQKDLDDALHLKIHTFETCWWENQNGKFVKRKLPAQAQTSTAQGILIFDVNQDGNPDIVICGNKYGFEVETNQANAGNGTILLGNGNGEFAWLNNTRHGFWAMKEGRDMSLVKMNNNRNLVLVANNNGPLQAFLHIGARQVQ